MTTVCFYKDGKVSLTMLRLKIYVNNGIKMSKQSLILKDEAPSKPTHLEGLRCFMALLTSVADIDVIGKKSVMIE
jgi:hypothetical protein